MKTNTETEQQAATTNTSIIETMGAEATTFEKTLKGADLNWEVKEDKVIGVESKVEMPRKKLLYRSDTRAPLGIVGSEYSPSDPKAFLEQQFEFAKAIEGKVVRAGFVEARSSVFAFVRYGDKIQIPKSKCKVGDPVQAYIYSTDGWSGNRPCASRLYVERLVCKNGLTSKEIKSDLWVSHTKSRVEHFEERREVFLEEVAKQFAGIKESFARLANTKMETDQMKAFLVELLPGASKRSEARRATLLEMFHTGAGNQGQTRWDAYNAVTEYVTHRRTYRETDVSSVETNRFTAVLETDTIAPRALNLLLN